MRGWWQRLRWRWWGQHWRRGSMPPPPERAWAPRCQAGMLAYRYERTCLGPSRLCEWQRRHGRRWHQQQPPWQKLPALSPRLHTAAAEGWAGTAWEHGGERATPGRRLCPLGGRGGGPAQTGCPWVLGPVHHGRSELIEPAAAGEAAVPGGEACAARSERQRASSQRRLRRRGGGGSNRRHRCRDCCGCVARVVSCRGGPPPDDDIQGP